MLFKCNYSIFAELGKRCHYSKQIVLASDKAGRPLLLDNLGQSMNNQCTHYIRSRYHKNEDVDIMTKSC